MIAHKKHKAAPRHGKLAKPRLDKKCPLAAKVARLERHVERLFNFAADQAAEIVALKKQIRNLGQDDTGETERPGRELPISLQNELIGRNVK